VATSAEEEEAEEEWRLSIIENLAKIHTPGGMESVSSFEIQQSRYSVRPSLTCRNLSHFLHESGFCF
jgi:hypothetical protein